MAAVEEEVLAKFWEKINKVSVDHIFNAGKLVHANSELDRAMVRDEPLTPIANDKPEYDELEEVELAVVDDPNVAEFEQELAKEVGNLHSDLVDEYTNVRNAY